jgi:hypothetical protein
MSARSIEVMVSTHQGPVLQTASESTGASRYWVKDKTGAVALQEVSRDDIGLPPGNGYYKLRLVGISDVFEMNGQYGRSQNVRLLLMVNQPGSHAHKQKFSEIAAVAKWSERNEHFYPTIGSRSKIGQMLGAIQGREIEANQTITLIDFLGGEFMANVKQTVKQTDSGSVAYANTIHDTITAVEQAAPVQAPPQAAPAATGNPFLGEDDL